MGVSLVTVNKAQTTYVDELQRFESLRLVSCVTFRKQGLVKIEKIRSALGSNVVFA